MAIVKAVHIESKNQIGRIYEKIFVDKSGLDNRTVFMIPKNLGF